MSLFVYFLLCEAHGLSLGFVGQHFVFRSRCVLAVFLSCCLFSSWKSGQSTSPKLVQDVQTGVQMIISLMFLANFRLNFKTFLFFSPLIRFSLRRLVEFNFGQIFSYFTFYISILLCKYLMKCDIFVWKERRLKFPFTLTRYFNCCKRTNRNIDRENKKQQQNRN